jgi:hypothetical protein
LQKCFFFFFLAWALIEERQGMMPVRTSIPRRGAIARRERRTCVVSITFVCHLDIGLSSRRDDLRLPAANHSNTDSTSNAKEVGWAISIGAALCSGPALVVAHDSIAMALAIRTTGEATTAVAGRGARCAFGSTADRLGRTVVGGTGQACAAAPIARCLGRLADGW